MKIILNNTEYTIDESALASAKTELQSHFQTTMSGSGTIVNLGGIAYNIDSTKLTTARDNFVSHLGTIAGSGTKIVVNGVEYAVDSTKIASAVSELEDTFSGLVSGGGMELTTSVVGNAIVGQAIVGL